jgi:hypothetical protein
VLDVKSHYNIGEDYPQPPLQGVFRGRFFDREVAETLMNTRFPILQYFKIVTLINPRRTLCCKRLRGI